MEDSASSSSSSLVFPHASFSSSKPLVTGCQKKTPVFCRSFSPALCDATEKQPRRAQQDILIACLAFIVGRGVGGKRPSSSPAVFGSEKNRARFRKTFPQDLLSTARTFYTLPPHHLRTLDSTHSAANHSQRESRVARHDGFTDPRPELRTAVYSKTGRAFVVRIKISPSCS